MFGLLVVCYLFLGGAGAGLLGVTVVLDVFCRRVRGAVSRRMVGVCYAASFLALTLGCVCLLADLGRPDFAFSLFASPHPTALTFGAFSLLVALAAAALFATLNLFEGLVVSGAVAKATAVLAIAAAVAVAVYTGVLLYSLRAVVFFSSVWVPVLFSLSSLSCGLAAVVGLSAFFPQVRLAFLRMLSTLDVVVIVMEACALASFLLRAQAAAPAQATQLLAGDGSLAFWLGLVLCGLIAPLALDAAALRLRSPSVLQLAAVLVLVGGFALRWIIVAAGASPDMAAAVGAMFYTYG